jgi:esterase
MSTPSTGRVASGDVTLFYRRCGTAGAAPVLILHGANYFDSADWEAIAAGLARGGREVVAFDQRGFGESTWSPSKNYSIDANIGDISVLLDHLGWKRCVVMGHSRGGFYATIFAARFPARSAGLVLVDYAPGAGPPPGAQSVNNKPKAFPTLEALQGALSRDKNTPPGSLARTRLLSIVEAVDGGYIVSRRDPDFMNATPFGATDWRPEFVPSDLWQELATVRAPIQILRGTKSDRFPPEALSRLQHDFPHVQRVDIESGHDMAAVAPQAVITVVNRFLQKAVDTRDRG